MYYSSGKLKVYQILKNSKIKYQNAKSQRKNKKYCSSGY